MRSVAPGQLTLSFETALPDRFNTLRDYVAFRVQQQGRPAKSIAADLDMAPSTLSRKLTPSESDTQRFNIDDLELYIEKTKDVAPIEYLVAKFMQAPELRQAAAIDRLEGVMREAMSTLQSLKAAT